MKKKIQIDTKKSKLAGIKIGGEKKKVLLLLGISNMSRVERERRITIANLFTLVLFEHFFKTWGKKSEIESKQGAERGERRGAADRVE